MNKRLFKSFVLLLGFCALAPSVRAERGGLLFTAQRISEIKSNAAYATLRDRLLNEVNSYLPYPVPATPDSNADCRLYEGYVENVTIAYLLTGKSEYLQKVSELLNAMAGYSFWKWVGGTDLLTSHFIMGLAFGYDYLYDRLDSALRTKIKNRLLSELDAKFADPAQRPFFTATARSDLVQNHLWISNQALYAGTLALRDEIPADRKTAYANAVNEMMINRVLPALPRDGSGQEADCYTCYGLLYLLKFLEMKKHNENQNLYGRSDYFKYIMYYLRHMTLPGYAPSRVDDWYNGEGPAPYFARLADEWGDPRLQWCGQQDARKARPLYSLMWYNPGLAAAPLTETIRRFIDGGEVLYRTGWDTDAAFVYFRCGRHYTAHSHPDNNQLLVAYKGSSLITDHGYSYFKTTQEHNTLLVENYGQKGEGYMWPASTCYERPGVMLRYASDQARQFMYCQGEAAAVYRAQAGLKSFRRQVTMLGNFLFITDEIEADAPRFFEIRFHSADTGTAPDTVNRFSLFPGDTVARVTRGRAGAWFFMDTGKEISLRTTYCIGTYGTAARYAALQSYRPNDSETVPHAFTDLSALGAAPIKHGFHLSQKNRTRSTSCMFNTLIALTDSGAIRPPVTPLSSGRMAGYRIADSNRTLIYLFNPEGDSNRTARYDQFSFQGKILLACAARDSGQWTVFTEYGPASPRISAGPPARKHTRLIVYANPGKSAVSFGFNNPPAAGNIKILIYNSAGACVADLTKSGTGAGTIFWDGSRTAAGVYCARMFVNGKSVALGRFALMK